MQQGYEWRNRTLRKAVTEEKRLAEVEGRATVAAENLQRYLRQLPPDRQRRVMEQFRDWLLRPMD